MKQYFYYVYIMASHSGTLYIGVTNNIINRSLEHKQEKIKGFTQKYKCNRLVYYETFSDINLAIKREKELKGWLRKKKQELIKTKNPHWRDLSADWGFHNLTIEQFSKK